MHLRVFGQHGIAEELVALVVVVTLLARVGLVVLVADFQVFDVERLWVAVLGAQRTILSGHRSVGILQGVERLVNPRLYRVDGREAAMPDAHVDHIERFGPQVLCQLQVLMEADAIGRAVAPVDIPVARTLFHWTDGALPAERVVGALLTFDKATAREAEKLRVEVIEHGCQVRTHPVLAVVERGGHEAHHVEVKLALASGLKPQQGFRMVGIAGHRGLILGPLVGELLALKLRLGKLHASAAAADERFQLALELSLGPERQFVGAALYGGNAPVALIVESVTFTVEGHLQRLALSLVEQALVHEAQGRVALGLPVLGSLVVVLEAAVADELSIETTVGGVVDVFIEDAIEHGRHRLAFLGGIHVDRHLCRCAEGAQKQGG